jgi:ATP-dependent DNA helicase RecG
MRAGESLTEMDETTLKSILNETTPDFSRQIVKGLSLTDLDEDAINNFRKRWSQKSRRDDYLAFSDEKMLRATGLLTDKGINYACLILFGKKEKIDELIPCSEIVFEWRQDARKISHDFRINWREPFFKFYDKIWDAINARNLRIPFQEGLFQREIYAFSEKPVREALLNAVAHRDYTNNSQSIFIKASPEEFIIESPGGFPPGITLENILHKTSWRNRMIAETFEKAGLAERSGQGVDDIFESTIKEGKGMPDLAESDTHLVRLRIPAQDKDENFIFFLEKVARSKQLILSFEQIYELEKIREQQRVPKLKYTRTFLELGIIESIGRTRGTKYILSHKYYAQEGKVGTHTRLTGLSRDQIKELILNHLRKNRKGVMKDFLDAFRDLKQQDLNNLLQELKRAGKVIREGARRSGYWVLREGN